MFHFLHSLLDSICTILLLVLVWWLCWVCASLVLVLSSSLFVVALSSTSCHQWQPTSSATAIFPTTFRFHIIERMNDSSFKSNRWINYVQNVDKIFAAISLCWQNICSDISLAFLSSVCNCSSVICLDERLDDRVQKQMYGSFAILHAAASKQFTVFTQRIYYEAVTNAAFSVWSASVNPLVMDRLITNPVPPSNKSLMHICNSVLMKTIGHWPPL